MTHPTINWHRLALAQMYYLERGFNHIEVPWLVRPESVDVTLPPGRRRFDTWGGTLVGSAEQAFIDIRADLKVGDKLQTVTPCFRDEPAEDELHRRWFMKLELIHVLDPNEPMSVYDEAALAVARTACAFHQHLVDAAGFPEALQGLVCRVETSTGWDVEVDGVEVGSYGWNSIENDAHEGPPFVWAYGTGVALPRLTQAIARLKEKT